MPVLKVGTTETKYVTGGEYLREGTEVRKDRKGETLRD